MASSPWYERHAWIVFLIVSLLALFIGISGENGPVGADSPFGAMAARDASPAGLELQLRGTFALGMGVFGIFIAAVPFRRFEKWAWFAALAWPVFFALHILAFGTWIPDAVLLALCIAALGASARRSLAN